MGGVRAWLFPGQGAQGRGMGSDVLDRYPRDVADCSETVGWDLRAQCLDNAWPGLVDTRHVQPALFLVECLTARAALDDGAPPPAHLAGHSLGEYAALQVAGVFGLREGIALVAERGACMSEAATGSMAAVVGLADEVLSGMLAGSVLDLANINSARQVVVSGPADALAEFRDAVRERGGRCVPLQVSAPFHSRYMQPAAERLAKALAACPMREPALPVLSNVTARPHTAPDAVRDLLTRQLTDPVRWRACVQELRRAGVSAVTEMGPGATLTRLWEQELADTPTEPAAPAPAAGLAAVAGSSGAAALGSAAFREDYGIELACLAGSMYRGIASVDLVARMGAGGMLGFLGTGGLRRKAVDAGIAELTRRLGRGGRFGVNLINQPGHLDNERAVVDSALGGGVRFAEVSSYTHVTPEVVRFRFSGATGSAASPHLHRHIVVKVSRPEVAREFLRPAPADLVDELEARGDLTSAEARIARAVPVAGDLCVEGDSGGHTDGANPLVVLPAILRLRDRAGVATRVGASGGIGGPEAVAAMFAMGADFVTTGSINQCTVEAGTSDTVKDLLAELEVTDTAYAPAGDMLELGARVQVVRRRTLFAARANRLMQLARWHDSLESLPAALRVDLQERVLRHSFDEIWQFVQERHGADAVAATSARNRMLLTFRWYFAWTTELALAGDPDRVVDYQVHCGPAMGLLNGVLADTPMRGWRDRRVDEINRFLMEQAATLRPRPVAPRGERSA